MPPRLTALRDLLSDHPTLDATEQRHQQRIVDLCDRGIAGDLDPFARACFVPGHFTASSFVLGPSLDTVLLILHAKLGFWMQPGGHIDPDDPDVLAAARREVAEETGLEALELWPPKGQIGLLDMDIHPIPAHRSEPAHEHFDLRYLFRSATTAIHENDETRGAQWVALQDFETVRSDASVMRAVTRIRHILQDSAGRP